jgi:hypothetical protein
MVRLRCKPPLACFAGLWTRWKSVRKVKEGEVTAGLFGFLNDQSKFNCTAEKLKPLILRDDFAAFDRHEQGLFRSVRTRDQISGEASYRSPSGAC